VDLWENNKELGWFNKVNIIKTLRGTEFTAQYSSNQYGFRGNKDINKERETILIIGDSFVQACEVDNDEVFTFILDSLLTEQIINAGVRGYGIDQEYLLFKQLFEENINIKHVIIMFYINDLRDIISDNKNSEFPEKPRFILRNDSLILYDYDTIEVQNADKEIIFPTHLTYRVSRFIKVLLYKSAIYKIFANALQFNQFGKWLYNKNLVNKPDYMTYDWRLADEEILIKSIPLIKEIFKNADILCSSNKATFTVFVIPSEFQYQKKLANQMKALNYLYNYESNIDLAYERVIEILKEEKINYLYPLNEFTHLNQEKTLTFRFDKHWNKNGHEQVAGILRRYFDEDRSNGTSGKW
ncbi:hypothetical protein KAU15_04755, partial [candidate division WOR-3 bacterium]|nr:hypothetical protein [candidate division WOR-3 bacterium]